MGVEEAGKGKSTKGNFSGGGLNSLLSLPSGTVALKRKTSN